MTQTTQTRSFNNLAKPLMFVIFLVVATTAGLLLAGSAFYMQTTAGMFSSFTTSNYLPTPTQLQAIVHYATTNVVPQQNLEEITLTFNVLKALSPCNFLVFGLGHDSLMWASLNPRGTTIFLEEDPKWIDTVLQRSPNLRAFHVDYRTHLSQANQLLSSYKNEPDCMPPHVRLGNTTKCRLALTGLPDEVYDKEWDVVMIDAPRGYFAEAPGRMGAIFTVAEMARRRVKPGVTHVYLHDVNRKVEKVYAEEFLCMKNKVEGVGRLWHFELPPDHSMSRTGFC